MFRDFFDIVNELFIFFNILSQIIKLDPSGDRRNHIINSFEKIIPDPIQLTCNDVSAAHLKAVGQLVVGLGGGCNTLSLQFTVVDV